jgi:hypothetical protein
MLVATTDPITRKKLTDTGTVPWVVEGHGPYALKIYFESEASMEAYLSMPLNAADSVACGVPRRYSAGREMVTADEPGVRGWRVVHRAIGRLRQSARSRRPSDEASEPAEPRGGRAGAATAQGGRQ